MNHYPSAVQEDTEGASDAGTKPHTIESARHLKVSDGDSIHSPSFANLESAEAEMSSEHSKTDPALQPLETEQRPPHERALEQEFQACPPTRGTEVCSLELLNEPTSRENTVGNVRQEAIGGFTKAPNNNLEHTDQADFIRTNVEHRLNTDPAELHDAHETSQPWDNATFSLNRKLVIPPQDSPVQSSATSSDNAESLERSFPCGDEFFRPQTSIGASEISSVHDKKVADLGKQGISNQETDAAVIISTELNGWERFDAEESAAEGLFGCDQASGRKSQQNRELWEQLLDQGSEDNETHYPPSTSQFEAEASIDVSVHEGNQFWLASPGNPFVEGLDRSSNFSEADGFGATENIASSHLLLDFQSEVDGFCARGNIARGQLLPTYEVDMRVAPKEGPFHTDSSSINISQGQSVEKSWASESNGPCDEASRQRVNRPRFPSFSDIRKRASKSKESSFGSFLEQVPSFQADTLGHGVENGAEKWVANFDSMAPATHEGLSSLSLPREAGDRPEQMQKQTGSLFSQEAPSAKLSPIVKKVANKVRSKPQQEGKAVLSGKNSNTINEEQPKRWTWRHCICCSRAN